MQVCTPVIFVVIFGIFITSHEEAKINWRTRFFSHNCTTAKKSQEHKTLLCFCSFLKVVEPSVRKPFASLNSQIECDEWMICWSPTFLPSPALSDVGHHEVLFIFFTTYTLSSISFGRPLFSSLVSSYPSVYLLYHSQTRARDAFLWASFKFHLLVGLRWCHSKFFTNFYHAPVRRLWRWRRHFSSTKCIELSQNTS